MLDKIIEVNNVSVSFDMSNDKVSSIKEYFVRKLKGQISKTQFHALTDVSFDVKRGEVVGLIGHNGAGKSTMLKVISGILKPTSGSVVVRGKVVPLLELGSGFDFDLCGMENLYWYGALLGYTEDFIKSKYDSIVDFSGLNDFMNVPLRNYSSGMVMRLAFSIATIVQPDILIVDEILAVGDADFQKKSKERMLEMMGGGTTVLFVSHDIDQIREMCNRVVWIEHGEVVAQGISSKVCEAYSSR